MQNTYPTPWNTLGEYLYSDSTLGTLIRPSIKISDENLKNRGKNHCCQQKKEKEKKIQIPFLTK